jgi:hypothetical protein
MTPKEKAEDLFNKMFENIRPCLGRFEVARTQALIAVDEILQSEPRCPSDVDWDDVGATHQYYYEAQREAANKYYQQVKEEIEKL